MTTISKTQLFYNKISAYYPDIKENNLQLKYIEDFNFKKILPKNLTWKTILDIWCWIGYNLKFYSNKKAITYWIDLSKNNLKLAQTISPKSHLIIWDFLKNDFWNIKFDLITINLVLDHFSYKEKEKLFSKIYSLLNEWWYLIFSHKNPVIEWLDFNSQKNSIFLEIWNIKNEKNWYFKKDKLKIKEFFWEKMYKYHTSYEDFFKLIIKNNFKIIDYKDCFPSKKLEKIKKEEFDYYSQIPQFMIFKLQK